MSATEKVADAAVRRAIIDALHAGGLIPVLPLLEIIVHYTLPFRSVVSTASNSGYAVRIAGSESEHGFECGDALKEAKFDYPNCICVDPTSPNRFYIGDSLTVRVLTLTSSDPAEGGIVSPLAGSEQYGYADGVGSHARLSGLTHITCTSDGRTLFLCEQGNYRLRSLDIKTARMTTAAGDGSDRNLSGFGEKAALNAPTAAAFDRTTPRPDSVLYITCTNGLMRFDVPTGEVREVVMNVSVDPVSIVCAKNGLVLLSCNHSILCVDPTNGRTERIAGTDSTRGDADGSSLSESRFGSPADMCFNESDQSLFVADSRNKTIRRVTLPAYFFSSPLAPSD